MKTDYYCQACGLSFSEEKLPNINKVHHCGVLARVLDFFGEGLATEEAPTTTH